MKERRWFQFHFTTLILVVIWCATMQFLSQKGMNLHSVFATQSTRQGWSIKQMGFPLRSFEEIHGTLNGERVHTSMNYPGNVLIDLLFWIASVFVLGFLSEFLIRRRGSHQQGRP